MTILEAIQQRHSVRRYTLQPIEAEKVIALKELVEQCNRESGLHIQLVIDEPKAFASPLVHYGKFAGVMNYLAMIGPAADPLLDEKLGYYGEMIVLEAQRMGLNTCWVALTFRKNPKAYTVNAGEKLRCVISVGYGQNQGMSHKIKRIDQVAHCDGPMPEWFRQGVEAALLAPTAINQQKFVFTLHEGNKVEAKARWGFYEKIDLGIVKYHFEIAAGINNFTWI